VGIVRVDPGGTFGEFEARLSIHRAEVAFDLADGARGARVRTFIDANSNVLVVRVERRGTFGRPIRIQLARYVDDQLGRPEVEVQGDELGIRYVFPDGFTYAAHGILAEGKAAHAAGDEGVWRDVEARNGWVPGGGGTMRNWEVELEFPERRATLTLVPDTSAATFFLGVATSKEAANPQARARQLAHAAAGHGLEVLRGDHQSWWDTLWRRSSLVLSDRLVESLWYHGIYLLACQSRGRELPTIMPPGYYLPHGGWHGAVHTDYNVQMMYWPAFTANQIGLAKTYFEFFRDHIDTMKGETRQLYGIDGIKVPGLTNGTCRELSYLPCRNWQCGTAWCAQLFWWGYQYTGDLGFLRESAYPFMREAANFYQAYAVRGQDGKRHIFPSTPPEQPPWWATDPAIDVALIRMLMKAVLEASDILGLDPDLRAGWRELLESLAEIPNNGEVLLDHRDAAPDSRLGHTGLLCPVYTAGEIGLGSSREVQEMAVRTLRGVHERTSRAVAGYPFDIHTWNDDCCWPNLIGYAARLGLAEEARDYLYDYGIFQHLKPNGLFAFDCPVNDGQRLTRWGMPDSNEAMTAVVCEMLIQSYDGVIRIAPAVPREWDAKFERFLGVGAFEVDAEIAGGRVQRVSLRSLAGSRCRLVSPWPGQTVEVRSNGRAIAFDVEGGIIELETQPNGVYQIRRTAPGQAGQTRKEPTSYRNTRDGDWGPVRYTGPSFVGEVPQEERMGVWLGMPARESSRTEHGQGGPQKG
jgi:hypothetical protein